MFGTFRLTPRTNRQVVGLMIGLPLFFADFRKGFGLIDHTILLSKLHPFHLHPCLVRWIAAFLEGRSQSVRIGSDFSNIRSLNGGIPQGTKLGPVLFAVIVNDLVNTWSKRTK